MATWLNDVTTGLDNLGGVARLSDIYAEVRKIRASPHPKSIDATIRGTIERNSSDSAAYTGKTDLFFSVKGLGAGIWGLRSKILETPKAGDIGELPHGVAEPQRQKQTIYRVLRETELARKLKLLHKNRCQLCGLTLKLADSTYAEAHHLIPLGAPHHGPDVPGNILVVCPNCHVKLDYFSITLDMDTVFTLKEHAICGRSIQYHNAKVAVT